MLIPERHGSNNKPAELLSGDGAVPHPQRARLFPSTRQICAARGHRGELRPASPNLSGEILINAHYNIFEPSTQGSPLPEWCPLPRAALRPANVLYITMRLLRQQ
jgi:hypothetical protein